MTKTKKKVPDKLTPLKNIKVARAYLNAILYYNPNDTEQFMIGLRHIITAQGGRAKLAKKMKVSLYKLNKMLAETDPFIFDLLHILKTLHLNLQVKPAETCTDEKPAKKKAQKKNNKKTKKAKKTATKPKTAKKKKVS